MPLKPPIKQSARRANVAATLLASASLALTGLGTIRDKLTHVPSNQQTPITSTTNSELEDKIKHDLAQANKMPAGIVRLNVLRQFATTRITEGLAKGSNERRQYAQLISEHLIRAAVKEHAKLPDVQKKAYDGLIRELFDTNEVLLDIQPSRQLRKARPNMENNFRAIARKRV